MGEWCTESLEEVLTFREGPGIMAADFTDKGVPLIRLAGLKRGATLLEGCNYLDPDKVAKKWKQFRLLPGDVLLSTSASLGEVATVPEEAVGAVPYTGIISFRPRDERIDRSFIPHMLTTGSFKAQIEAMGVGSVMKHFGPSHLRQMTVSFPTDVSEQRGIAEALGALDDKIAANGKVIKAADDLAHSRFQIAASSEVPLSSLARFVNGRAFTKDATGTGRVVVRIAELNSGIGGSTVYNDIEVADDHLARPGDLLFAWSGSLTAARWFRPEAIVNQHIFKVVPNPGVPIWLVNQAVHAKLNEFQAIAADKATTMGHIQRRHLDEAVRVPYAEDAKRIDGLMTSLWDAALAAEIESLKLAETRDELLPLLMSGRVRVRDAEKAVEAVV
jgi:type I restriction enzyme S subunit